MIRGRESYGQYPDDDEQTDEPFSEPPGSPHVLAIEEKAEKRDAENRPSGAQKDRRNEERNQN